MMRSFLLLTITCSIIILGSETQANSSNVKMSIEMISPLIAQDGAPSEAIAGLKLSNFGINKAIIPICAMAGKGGNTGNSCLALQLDGKQQPTASGCATVEYQWLNADKTVISDCCALTSREVELAPGGSELLKFPIKIPKKKGSYLIILTFDNRILLPVLRSSNSVVIISHVTGAPVIFKETKTAKVEIGVRK